MFIGIIIYDFDSSILIAMISSFILQNPIMDTCRISVESNHRMMIKNMIRLAMKQEVSWTLLSSFLDDVSSTIEKSKQVIRILLDRGGTEPGSARFWLGSARFFGSSARARLVSLWLVK